MPAIAVPAGSVQASGKTVGTGFLGPTTGSVALVGIALTVGLVGPVLAVPTGSIALSGQAPSFGSPALVMGAGALDVSGQYVAPTFGDPAAGALGITGRAPTLGLGSLTFAVPAAAVALSGTAPILAGGSSSPSLGVGALGWAGRAPSFPFSVPYEPVASVDLSVEVRLEGDTAWTDITADVELSPHLTIRRGISSNTPLDSLADSGHLSFVLRNDSGNSAGLLGRYSPLHANALPGLVFGIPVRVRFSYESSLSVASLTQVSGTATATTSTDHGVTTGQYVEVDGAFPDGYNGVRKVAVTGATTFTYAVDAGLSSPATGTITARRTFVVFTGKIDSIAPSPGVHRDRMVRVVAYDAMRDLLDSDVRDVALQVNKYDDAVTNAVLDAAPSGAQPVDRDIDPGLDLMQYALHDLGNGARVGAVLSDICRSTHALAFITGDGTYRQINRNTRATTTSSFTFVNVAHGLEAPSTLENVYNRVRTVSHPMDVPAATVTLCSLTGSADAIPAGGSQTFELSFRDPNDTRRLIGGTAAVTTLVAGTDYAANSQADGLGTDLTASVSVVVAEYATRAVFLVTNNAAEPAYLVDTSGTILLQLRGRGVYDNGPRTFESTSPQSYGDRPIDIDLPYQNDNTAAKQIADLILDQYDDLSEQIDFLTILGNYAPTFMAQALGREIGDVITVTETVTGLSGVSAMIRSCEYELIAGRVLRVRWGLGPAITIPPPDTPTGVTATVIADSAVTVAWTTGQAGASTQVYVQGPGDAMPIYYSTAGAGATSLNVYGLTRATDYTFSVRHVYFGLLSGFSNEDTARPVVSATGGSTFDFGGDRYHVFTGNGTFTQLIPGRLDWLLVGGGGGGGKGSLGSADWGGGAGGAGGFVEEFDNLEPAGAHAVVVGAGGVGATSAGASGNTGGTTSYRSNICIGGGAGAGGTATEIAGGNGGSGGGGGGDASGAGGSAAGSNGEIGNAGGASGNNPGGSSGGGGGGGAGSAGTAATTTGGAGGSGRTAFDGNTYCAGGIGGRGALGQAAGAANTGNGGGGGDDSTNGYNGGSGKVVIRYPI